MDSRNHHLRLQKFLDAVKLRFAMIDVKIEGTEIIKRKEGEDPRGQHTQ